MTQNMKLLEDVSFLNGKDEEIFKYIRGFGNRYAISNKGRVYACGCVIRGRLWEGKFLSQKDNNGYKQVALSKNSKQHIFYVHRLVAHCFCSKDCPEQEVNHIDGDKANNSASNLEWVLPKENTQHYLSSHPTKEYRPRLTDDEIKAVMDMDAEGISKVDIAERTGISYRHVLRLTA